MIRDERTKALISDDGASLNRYKYDRAQARRVSELEEKVEKLNNLVLELVSRMDAKER